MARKWLAVAPVSLCILLTAASVWALPCWLDGGHTSSGTHTDPFNPSEAQLPHPLWQLLLDAGQPPNPHGHQNAIALYWPDMTSARTLFSAALEELREMPAFRQWPHFSVAVRRHNSSGPLPVPEPATLLLLGIGLIASAIVCRRRMEE